MKSETIWANYLKTSKILIYSSSSWQLWYSKAESFCYQNVLGASTQLHWHQRGPSSRIYRKEIMVDPFEWEG